MAEKQTNKDRMREIVDSIENGIKELFESDKYRKYLATMSRFHRYWSIIPCSSICSAPTQPMWRASTSGAISSAETS